MSGLDYLLFVIMGVVLVILISGVVVMAIGGETNRKYSNKLMMARVATQVLAVLLLGILFMISHK